MEHLGLLKGVQAVLTRFRPTGFGFAHDPRAELGEDIFVPSYVIKDALQRGVTLIAGRMYRVMVIENTWYEKSSDYPYVASRIYEEDAS